MLQYKKIAKLISIILLINFYINIKIAVLFDCYTILLQSKLNSDSFYLAVGLLAVYDTIQLLLIIISCICYLYIADSLYELLKSRKIF